MRKFGFLQIIAATLFLGLAAPVAHADSMQARETFVRDLAQNALSILKDTKKSNIDKRETLLRAFTDNVDCDMIARSVADTAWSNASPEQQQRYLSLYRDYLANTYMTYFKDSESQQIRDIRVTGIADEGDERFSVSTEMSMVAADNLRVDYLVRDHNSRYKIVDIIINGVSLVVTHRAEFNSLAASQGMDGVISRLEQLAAHSQQAMTLSMNYPRQ